MVLVSIIFVNYKGKKEDIRTCLSSLYRQTMKDFEVILVDNDSLDDSVDYVRENFPKVKIIQNKNTGFAAGNNLGVKHAKGKYVFILNLDTELDKDCLKELVGCAQRNKDAAISCKILLFEKKNRINTTGMAFHYLGYGWCDNLERNEKTFSDEMEVTFPSGAAFLVERSIYNKMGGFDESYFFYCEDSDFGWRMRLRGYRVVMASKAKVYHKYFFSRHGKKVYFTERNRLISILKNYETKTLFLILPPLLLTELGVSLYLFASRNQSFLNKVAGYYWIIRHFDKILWARSRVQKFRTVPDREIIKHFKDKIEFKYIQSSLIDSGLNPFLAAYWKSIKPLI